MIQTLREHLARRPRREIERPRRAAVLVPIIDDDDPARLLLTRRTDDLPTHRGQVAFPGGFMDPDERNPVESALREAEEEIGLPRDHVEILGSLDDQIARNATVAVTPIVGRIATLPRLIPGTGEVARIFTIPLEDLAAPGRWTERTGREGGRIYRFVAFDHAGERLWGLSARITLQLLELLGLGSPAPGTTGPASRQGPPPVGS